MSEKDVPDHWLTGPLRRITLAVNGVLFGVCTLFIAGMLALTPAQLDAHLHIALVAFAVALPPTVWSFVLALREHILSALVSYSLTALAGLAVTVGIAGVLFHLDTQAAEWLGYSAIACTLILGLITAMMRPKPPTRRR